MSGFIAAVAPLHVEESTNELLLKDVRDQLTDARFNELYTTWVLTSDHGVYDLVPPDPCELWPNVSFCTHFIDADYRFLSP